MPRPTEPVKRICHADDITVWALGVKLPELEHKINDYLTEMSPFLRVNSAVTLLTPDPKQANTHPKIKISDAELPLVRNPMLDFTKQARNTYQYAGYATQTIYRQSICNKITHRNLTSKNKPQDPSIPELNKEISTLISTNKTDIWKEHIEKPWDHRRNTSTYWNTIHGPAHKRPPQQDNNYITLKNNTHINPKDIASAFNKQLINTIPHKTNTTNRKITRKVLRLQPTQINITTDTKLHSTTTRYLSPNITKTSTLGHHTGQYSSYLLLQTLEKVILPYITHNIPNITTQHGFKTKHYTNTALHNINNTVATGFNQPIPPSRTIAVALGMSKAFATVNIPHTILRYIANYSKGRMA